MNTFEDPELRLDEDYDRDRQELDPAAPDHEDESDDRDQPQFD
jgi:hypothetical protein